jgi:hypothetical protein
MTKKPGFESQPIPVEATQCSPTEGSTPASLTIPADDMEITVGRQPEARLSYGQQVDGLDLPEGWSVVYKGYGWAGKWETKDYLLTGGSDGAASKNGKNRYEISIPEDPKLFPPEAVRRERRCQSALTLEEAIAEVFQARAEAAAAEIAEREHLEAAIAKANARVVIPTRELDGPALDWAVAACEKENVTIKMGEVYFTCEGGMYCPSRSAEQAWPIIEREKINLVAVFSIEGNGGWAAVCDTFSVEDTTEGEQHDPMFKLFVDDMHRGQTSLVAAMRCYVGSKLGKEVSVPEDLMCH